ncbi:MAG: DUF177 domain-containing protein [Spirosomataceae bacterium]
MNREFSAFDINIHGLETKTYEYDFEGDDSFFSVFEQEIIEGGSFKAKVILDKTSTLIRLNFEIYARLKLLCDRSLETFEEDFKINEMHIFKFGHNTEEISDEMDVIPFGTPKINVAELIFDYVLLQVPIKKLHPRFRDEISGDEEGVMIYQDQETEKESESKETDPRWAALLNLKDKK